MDAARLQKCIDNNVSGFVSFDSRDAEVSVAWSHVLTAQFLWDGPGLREPSLEDQAPTITVWFHHPEPMTFEVEFEEDSTDIEEQGPIRSFLFGLDLGIDVDEPFASFDDIDGERVSLRIADVEVLEASFAIFQIPGDEDDDDNEDNGSPTLVSTDAPPTGAHGN
jgi:hypothetical protein